MAGFKHACFISYRHIQFGLGDTFVKKLLEALQGYVEFVQLDEAKENEKVYLDEERLKGGYNVEAALSEAICSSVCMIVIYTNNYFNQDHPFCAREFKAMEALEKKRAELLESGKYGLIIPILFMMNPEKDLPKLPPEIKARKYYDFKDYTPDNPDILSHPTYTKWIKEIADTIRDMYEKMQESELIVCDDCPKFMIPSVDEVKPYLETVAPKRPKKMPFR